MGRHGLLMVGKEKERRGGDVPIIMGMITIMEMREMDQVTEEGDDQVQMHTRECRRRIQGRRGTTKLEQGCSSIIVGGPIRDESGKNATCPVRR
jgi:hypothetical protein